MDSSQLKYLESSAVCCTWQVQSVQPAAGHTVDGWHVDVLLALCFQGSVSTVSIATEWLYCEAAQSLIRLHGVGSKLLTEVEVGRGAVVGQGRRGCEGVGGALVGQGHPHGAGGGAEAQGAVVEAAVSDGGEAGGRALVQLVVAGQRVPPGAAATARVGHWMETETEP